MLNFKYFLLLLYTIIIIIEFGDFHHVKNLRQLTFSDYNVYNPIFSPDGKKVSFISRKIDYHFNIIKNTYNWHVYEIAIDEIYPKRKRISSGLGSTFNIGYLSNDVSVLASNIFFYPNLTVALNDVINNATYDIYNRDGKLQVIYANKYGNIMKRFDNFTITDPARFYGYKNNYILYSYVNNNLILTNINNGKEKVIYSNDDDYRNSTGSSFITAVFSKNKNILYYCTSSFKTDNNDKTKIYSINLNTNEKNLILTTNVTLGIIDICSHDKHFIVNTLGEIKDYTIATINIETHELNNVLLSNKIIQGYHPKLSFNDKKLIFVKMNPNQKRNQNHLFIVDWEIETFESNHKKQRKIEFNKNSIKRNFTDAIFRGKYNFTNNIKTSKKLMFNGEEKHLKNIRQLTFGGANAEGYFAFQHDSFVFQATGLSDYGTNCDQIYRLDFNRFTHKKEFLPIKLSTGLGSCTCSYLFPGDKTAIYASTFLEADLNQINNQNIGTCTPKKCQSREAITDPVLKVICNTAYTWDLHPSYDIFKVDEEGNFLERITNTSGYDAEGAISPDGKLMVFTSVRSGDPELWLYNFEEKTFKQLTNGLGYDGGPFFSPDGTKIGFRASRPRTSKEIDKYKLLLKYDLVEPLNMDLYTINVDGSNLRQITNLGNSSWAPFYLNDNYRIVFSSNFNEKQFGSFNLYIIDDDGENLEQITYSNGFDAFPMMSRDGKLLIWGSSRNVKSRNELNLFIADWYD